VLNVEVCLNLVTPSLGLRVEDSGFRPQSRNTCSRNATFTGLQGILPDVGSHTLFSCVPRVPASLSLFHQVKGASAQIHLRIHTKDTLTHSLTHSLSLFHSHTQTHTHSLTHKYTHTLSLSHTHTHTHSLSLSLSSTRTRKHSPVHLDRGKITKRPCTLLLQVIQQPLELLHPLHVLIGRCILRVAPSQILHQL
jgi:hypothetical protein